MTNNILNEFKVMLQENTWMDATSKAKAIEKANYIKTDIGYPDYYDNITFVKTKFNVIVYCRYKLLLKIRLINPLILLV